jgi:trehalose-phosphatase
MVFQILRAWPWKVAVSGGKKVWDIRPVRAWNKGKAVTWILDHVRYARAVLPVYIGDDQTDEDAFRALRGRGITVRVRRNKSSAARYYVTGVSEVKQCLKQLLQS